MLNELFTRYPVLKSCEKDLVNAKDILLNCFKNGNKLLLCGNGGSCADCEHIVGELMKGFLKKRPLPQVLRDKMLENCPEIPQSILNQLQGALPAISLPAFCGLNSAFCNDVDPELIYAQSIIGLGTKGDVVICISTSGNSKNVYAAALTAKALGITVISLTGEGGGKLKPVSDVCICVPETETFKVQELHLPSYHYLCAAVEAEFFAE